MTDATGENAPAHTPASRLSRRSFVRYGAAGVGVAILGSGVAVMANRPPLSPRQQGLPDLPDWTAADIPSLRGRSVLVTGGNGYPVGDRSGLGFHDALELARAGADVTIASRNQERGEEAVRFIKADVPNASIRFETLDLSDLASVVRFADRMHGSGGSLDILVNNAGVMGRKSREVSANGFERVFATNTLGHFALTARLLPLLRRSDSPRVVWVSSSRSFMGAINFADLQQVQKYDYGAAYDNSKLANLMLAFEMQRRSVAEGWGVSAIAAHPGIARTNLVLDGPGPESLEGRNHRYMPFLFQTAAQGALPTLYAAASPHAAAGGYYGPNGVLGLGGLPGWAGIPEKADDQQVAARLWATLERLGGVTFGQMG
ncbi:oxidoreductase [Kaistia dalseonensis]|uniref:NAD(P)-dependent dehydrogenase (Short-subunit alcohol dehydrogenase family) n=1 Tax=Kaistia dalseonensis TaxID=410840 RepID=A0ABU0H2G8_9HYPH|nr:oxidoreductase [Kaistia dalseonensis]MCX5493935.1 oxidoreductase [Kaistia dalseonensis]MDQ0436508.1 NAD(P)-dependent dehydrogenase (short-subunit alcohol dehydrogenase family) [Kaistia dalseonensis]